MRKLKKILYPTDFSRCAEQALTHAVHFAEQYGAQLHMLHAVILHAYDPNNPEMVFPSLEDEDLRRQLNELAGQKMQVAAAAHGAEGLVVRHVEDRGISAAAVILDYAERNDMDLIVMGTHGRRGLSHMLLGSVAEEVVRQAHCPVLTVRERQEPARWDEVDRILVPVDFSEHSRRAVTYGKILAESYGARLQVLHVFEQQIHPAFYAIGKTSLLQVDPDLASRARLEMSRMVAEAPGPEVEVDVHVAEGKATREIVRFAEEQASDFVVIATHGLTGLEHFLLGSVAEKVVRHCPCPVFTVKAFGKELTEF
jgi:nucleotide-binding universal stress UspA family protein